jgi:hypothetical protein
MSSESTKRPSKAALGMAHDTVGVRVTLRDALDVAIDQAPSLIKKVLDGLVGKGDKSFKMAARPNFPPHVEAVVATMVGHGELVRESFVDALRGYVYRGAGTSMQSPQMMRFEDLKLFEEEDLDQSIEVARAMQEISLSTDDVLPQLDALMSSLLGWITVQPLINPLRPEMFARALRDCISEHSDNPEVRGIIIAHASGRMGILLRKLYPELCNWLKSYGVEEASNVQPQLLPGASKPGVASAVSNSVARTLLNLDRLRRLLSGELDADGTRKPQDFLHTVPASVVALQDMRQVEAMVQRLEKKAKQAQDEPSQDSALRKARARMAATDNRELGKQLGEEVVRLMLDNLIQDDRLLPRVRGQVQTLEPMLMGIAKGDGRFFSDKQHVARQLLDKITNRSLAFTSERDEGYDDFVKSVEKGLNALTIKMSRGESAEVAIGGVLDQLQGLWERLDAEARVYREEAAKALLHAEQRNMLAQYLAQEFRDLARDADIPQMVIDFVTGPWSHAVAESQLLCTDGRSDPEGYHELVAELYWSVQPSKAKRNRKRLVNLIPGMLAKLRHGLQTIDFPSERITDFFSELIELHEAALEGGRPKAQVPAQLTPEQQAALDEAEDQAALQDRVELEALYAESSQVPLEASVAPEDAPTMPALLVLQEEAEAFDSHFEDFPSSRQDADQSADSKGEVWLGKREAMEAGFVKESAAMPMDPNASVARSVNAPAVGASVPLGAWVEIMLEGQWVRAQLTWASPHRTLFMFVSRGGKAHSMSKRTMDKLRSQNLIRLISDGHLVDKALDAVAQTALRNSVDESKT